MISPRQGEVAGCCEHSDETSDSIKIWGISRLAEELSASEGICCTELALHVMG